MGYGRRPTALDPIGLLTLSATAGSLRPPNDTPARVPPPADAEGEFPANDRHPPTTAARARSRLLPRVRGDVQPRRPREGAAQQGTAHQGPPDELAPLQEAAADRHAGSCL